MANKFTDFNPGIINSGGRKNFIINGNMDIWQRANSGTVDGSLYYISVDRWMVRTVVVGGSVTVSKQSIVSSDSGAPRLKYCARVARNNNDTSQLQFVQMVESIDAVKFAGMSVTLSFYARKHANWTAQNSNLNAVLYEGTGTDEKWYSYTNSNVAINSNATLTTSWQRFNFTTTLRSTTTEFAVYFEFAGVGTNPTNDYFEITGVQLELGSVATPFEYRPFAEELALCQRYYEVGTVHILSPAYTVNAYVSSTAYFKVTKRIAPTSGIVLTNESMSNMSTAAATTITVGNFTLFGQSLAGALITEWYGTFKADAEL